MTATTATRPAATNAADTETLVLSSGQRVRVSRVEPTGLKAGEHDAAVPLLLLNGLGAPLDLFEPIRAELAHRPTIAFDVPGVGGSPSPWFMPPMRWYSGIVGQLLDRLELDTVDVMGLSWGGALAQDFARREPDRVRRLVLAATMPGMGTVPGRPDALAILATPLRYYSPAYFEAIAPTLYGGAIRTNPELLKRHSRLRTNRPPNPFGYVCQLAAVGTWSSLPWLGRLVPPTLVLAGDDDPIIPLVNGRTLASLIPDARLEVIEDGGHLFLAARAHEVAPIIDRFLGGTER